jgi:hypothetical protein
MTEIIDPSLAEYRARCLVNGYAKHEKSGAMEPLDGQWSSRFQRHPWVVQAEDEGWGRDLRSTCILAAKQRIMAGVKPNDIQAEDVMPRQEWVDYFRDQARRGREAYEWRKANPDNKAIKGLVEIDPVEFLKRLGINKPEPTDG